jgi:hypothetical protein
MILNKLLLVIVLAINLSCFAQMNISTDLREDYVWSELEGDWVFVSSNKSEFTFLKFNEELTMFQHTTPTITSAYIINSNEYDEERDQYTFDVTSDVGNNYTLIIDVNNNNVRFIGENEYGLFVVRHNIKRLWLEE